MNLPMPWWGKILSFFFGTFLTVVGGVWTVAQIYHSDLEGMKNEAVQEAKEGEKRVIAYVDGLKVARDESLKLRDEVYQAKLDGISVQITDLKMYLGRKIDSKTSVVERRSDLYTNSKTENSLVGGSL